MTVTGQDPLLTISNGSVTLASNGQLVLTGNNDQVGAYSGGITLNGTGNYGTIDGSSLAFGTGASASLSASYDVVNDGSNSVLTLSGNVSVVWPTLLRATRLRRDLLVAL